MRATILRIALSFIAAASMTRATGSEVVVSVASTSPLADAGRAIVVPLYIRSGSGSALFGAELEVAAVTEDVAIRSVTLNPAFAARGGNDPAADADGVVRLAGVQPIGELDPSLGADGAAVPFATVEVEVLTDRPFESALIVRARGALVGSVPDSTTVLGNPSGPDGWGEGRVVIATEPRSDEATEVGNESGPSDPGSLDPLVPPTDGPEAGPWTLTEAPAVFEIRPVGSQFPARVLAPDTEYEIHFVEAVGGQPSAVSPAGGSVGFDLIVTGPPTAPSTGSGQNVEGSEMPVFEACWAGATVTELPPAPDSQAPSAPEPLPRLVVSADALTGNSELETGNSHLCHFTTGAAGAVGFDLRLYAVDPALRHTVEMRATAEYEVATAE